MHYQKTKRDMTALDRFLSKEKWHFQVIWKFSTFREYCLLPEKQMRSNLSFMHTYEEKTFLSLQMQRHERIIWSKFNLVWYLHSILFITSQSENSMSHGIYIFLQPSYLQRYDMQMQQLEKVHLYVIVSTLLVDQLLVLVDRF